MNAQDEAFVMVAHQRGLITAEIAQQVEVLSASASGPLAQLCVQQRFLSARQVANLLVDLRREAFACPRCAHRWNYEALRQLVTMRCPKCEEQIAMRTASGRLRDVLAETASSPIAVAGFDTRTRRDPGGTHADRTAHTRVEGHAFVEETLHDKAPPGAFGSKGSIGPYVLVGDIAQGSNGIVFLARREGLERKVALKVLVGPDAPDEEDLARFKLEAQVASKLAHPGVVSVFDFGRDGHQWYCAMEYCPGATLRERIREGMNPVQAARVVASVARTLAFAHEQGVLHRDVKPANIIIDETTGQPRVTDFGLARDRSLLRSMTQSGDVLGTPGYMSPEQFEGRKDLDYRVDIYGLGVILYECLTGTRPYLAATLLDLSVLVKEGKAKPADQVLPAVPRELSTICAAAMAVKREDRYSSAGNLADDLEAWLREHAEGATTPPAAPPSIDAAPSATLRLSVLAVGLLVVGLLVAFVAVTVSGRRTPSPKPTEQASSPPPPPSPSQTVELDPVPGVPPKPQPIDWALLYYMSYDNNLGERTGRKILDMLGQGLASDRVAVHVLADFEDTGGLRRYTLTAGNEAVELLPGEESSGDEATLDAFLAWVDETHPARRYALVFLNHGWGLNGTSRDDQPGPGGQRYMRIDEVGRRVAKWRARVAGEVELLFLQQPIRGNLETHYSLRGAARYLMTSQFMIGAPNYYYTASVRRLCERPEMDGLELAQQIADNERADMFKAYSITRAAALAELGQRLTPLLQALQEKDELIPPIQVDDPRRGEEVSFDSLNWLEDLAQQNRIDPAPYRAFKDWVESELIVYRRTSPTASAAERSWSGLSIFAPLTRRAFAPYADLPIYEETTLDDLLERMLAR